MRVFPFAFTEKASSRTTVCTPQLTGPAIIVDFQQGTSTYQDPPQKTSEIGKASTFVTEDGVALTTARPYQLLLELLNPFNVLVANIGGGYVEHTTQPIENVNIFKLGLIVFDNQFFATYSHVNAGLNVQLHHGWMRVLENVDSAILSQFLVT